MYGCETFSPTSSEEHRLSVFEQSAEENVWTEKEWNDGKVEKTA
jgi:hypothetical protein